MNEQKVKGAIAQAIRESRKLSGQEMPKLRLDLKPVEELDGFDSLIAIEVTATIGEKLGCEIKQDSVFVSADGTRALSLRETCSILAKLPETNGASE